MEVPDSMNCWSAPDLRAEIFAPERKAARTNRTALALREVEQNQSRALGPHRHVRFS